MGKTEEAVIGERERDRRTIRVCLISPGSNAGKQLKQVCVCVFLEPLVREDHYSHLTGVGWAGKGCTPGVTNTIRKPRWSCQRIWKSECSSLSLQVADTDKRTCGWMFQIILGYFL